MNAHSTTNSSFWCFYQISKKDTLKPTASDLREDFVMLKIKVFDKLLSLPLKI
jgi:hypothetical protein